MPGGQLILTGTMNNKIIVAGGGLAGSLLAVYLAHRKFEVEILESRPDMRRMEIPAGRSINLALAERGINTLRHAGVFDDVEKLLTPMNGRMLHDVDGSLEMQRYGMRESEVIYSVSRSELNMVMINAAEEMSDVHFRFNQKCIAADIEKSELACVDLSDDKAYTVSGSPIFGADGGGSVIRRAMQKSHGISASEDILGHSYKELAIPPAENGRHRIEKNALHIWPRGGFMLIALPNLDGSFTVTLFLPNGGENSFEMLTDDAVLIGFFEKHFPDALAVIPNLVEDFFTNPIGALGTVRCQPWSVSGKATLLGDAAHAVVPFHGQGMNAAFEDAYALDCLIEAHGIDWEKIFSLYQDNRKANADAIADMALENYIEMRDSVRDQRFHLQKLLAFELERRYPDRFIPRYSMVMFHHEIPYSVAQRRGSIQATLLTELTENVDLLDQVDMDRAAELVDSQLQPLG